MTITGEPQVELTHQQAIETFNEYVGGASVIIRFVQMAVDSESWNQDYELRKNQAANHLFGEILPQLVHRGLGLVAQDGSIVGFGLGAEIRSQEVEIQLIDGQAFVDYLKSTTDDSLSQTGREDLKFVAKSLVKHLAIRSDLNQPSDATLSLFGVLEKLVHEYQRLGLDQHVIQLDTMLQMARQKCLYEHLLIERSGVMAGKRHFGPAEWHTDMTTEHYRQRWQSAIELLKKVQLNPNASHLAQQAARKLRADIVFAQIDVPQQAKKHPRPAESQGQEHDFHDWNQAPEFLEILNWAWDELAQL